MAKKNAPFEIKDCALIAIATGVRAQNLRELRDKIETIEQGSIYYHFWGGRLRPRFDDPEYNNDFASWARHSLHDGILAERLGAIDPTEYDNLEELRFELMEIVEQRLDESEIVPWVKADQLFGFNTSQIVVFNTNKKISDPKDFAKAIPEMSNGSVFYHFIDSRRRTFDRIDDFSVWMYGFDYQYIHLIQQIAKVDPYFPTLQQIQLQLSTIFMNFFKDANGIET
jgi:hypothetical protein